MNPFESLPTITDRNVASFFITFQSYRSKSRLFPSSSNQGSGEDNLVIPNNPSSSSYLNQPSPSLSTGMPTSSATLQPSPCGPIPSSFGVIPGSTNVGTIGNHAGLGLASSSSLSNSSSIPAKGKHPNRFSGLFGLSAKVSSVTFLVIFEVWLLITAIICIQNFIFFQYHRKTRWVPWVINSILTQGWEFQSYSIVK